MISWLSELAARVMDVTNYGNPGVLAGLFLVAALTEIGIPFPLVLDTVLFFLGWHIALMPFQAILVVLVLFLGRECGATPIYWLSRGFGEAILKKVLKRFPMLENRVRRASKKLGTMTALGAAMASPSALLAPSSAVQATYTVALSRMTPGLLTLTSIACGVFGIRYRFFALGIGLASIIVDGAEIALGVAVGYGLLQVGISPGPWLIIVGAVANVSLIWLISLKLADAQFDQEVTFLDTVSIKAHTNDLKVIIYYPSLEVCLEYLACFLSFPSL